MVKSKDRRIINNLKMLTDQIKAMRDGDNAEFFRIDNKDDCCINVCNYIDAYLKNKNESFEFINEQINEINNTSISYRPDDIESWIGKANSEANKLKNQLLFKINVAGKIKYKINCSCD